MNFDPKTHMLIAHAELAQIKEKAFNRGRERGREEVLENFLRALGLEEYIANAIRAHEQQSHEQVQE